MVGRDSRRVHGEFRELADSRLDVGVTIFIALGPGEGGLLFCLDGRAQVTPGEDPALTGSGSTTPSSSLQRTIPATCG